MLEMIGLCYIIYLSYLGCRTLDNNSNCTNNHHTEEGIDVTEATKKAQLLQRGHIQSIVCLPLQVDLQKKGRFPKE